MTLSYPVNNVEAQNESITDSEALSYFSNPSSFVNKKVNFTGQILTVPQPDGSGKFLLQMYQGGDENRNTMVSSSTPIQFNENECIRVIGISQPIIEYQNAFGAKLTSASILADSIQKVDCAQSLEPAVKVINVGQTMESDGAFMSLDKLEFSESNTRAYLTIQNIDSSEDLMFNEYNSRAIQGNTQYMVINNYDTNYPKIASVIPAGVEEKGVVLFEPLDLTQDTAQFRFDTTKGFNNIRFDFETILSPDRYLRQIELLGGPDSTDPFTWIKIGDIYFDVGNYTESLRYYDKVLKEYPETPEVLWNKVDTLDMIGNVTGAQYYYDKAIALDPNLREASDPGKLKFNAEG
ncbi:MAG: tetratricopeptide repeat protein [Candidatus Nitrosocosmicus sp.]|nr:tetratricopeptide repeat protein [Candidatus Nitrosocosmicus sp.]MDN5868654.1 tetratricopeptide repeat protein [Candidatus Nitrosocosmicus sp.]